MGRIRLPACLILLALLVGCAEEERTPGRGAARTWSPRTGLHRDLLPERADAPFWYGLIRAATRGAPEDPGALVDLPRRMLYDVTSFITHVLHPELLPDDWQKQLVRVRGWPIDEEGRTTDAYYLRFERGGTIVHLLDRVGGLIVALAGEQFQSATEEQALAAQRLAFETVVRPELCGPAGLQRDPGTGIWCNMGIIRVDRKPATNEVVIVVKRYHQPIRFHLTTHVCPGVVIFRFGKLEVFGCADRGAGGPLFRHADAKPDELEVVLDELEALETPATRDIPRLATILRGLPRYIAPIGMSLSTREQRLLGSAKRLACRKLAEAVATIEAATPYGMALVRKALRAVPAESSLHLPRRAVREAAIGALVRIHSPDARALIQSLHDSATDRQLQRKARDALAAWDHTGRR